jgi:hypothetical protein
VGAGRPRGQGHPSRTLRPSAVGRGCPAPQPRSLRRPARRPRRDTQEPAGTRLAQPRSDSAPPPRWQRWAVYVSRVWMEKQTHGRRLLAAGARAGWDPGGHLESRATCGGVRVPGPVGTVGTCVPRGNGGPARPSFPTLKLRELGRPQSRRGGHGTTREGVSPPPSSTLACREAMTRGQIPGAARLVASRPNSICKRDWDLYPTCFRIK